MFCICGEELKEGQVACPACLEDMDKVADLLELRPRQYDGPMGIFEDYDFCDSQPER